MLDRLTDLDDHELDEQAAIFLHAKKSKKDPQSRFISKGHRKNQHSDAESLVTSFEDKSGFKFRPLAEPATHAEDKRRTLKGKSSLNTFQPRELSVETSDSALNSLRARRSNESDIPTSNNSRISKKPSKAFSNLGESKRANRLFSYTSDGGDSEEEEYFVYPKHRAYRRNSPKRTSSSISLNEAVEKQTRLHSGGSGASNNPSMIHSRKSELNKVPSPRITRSEYYQQMGSTDQERRTDRYYSHQHQPSYISDTEDDIEYISQRRHDKRTGRLLTVPKGSKQREESLGPRSFRRSRQQDPAWNGESEEDEETLPLFWKMNPETKRRKR
ncbi:hypothetical protein K493DRAFT_13046 [Basidiobolus meristosporus CBS 931.73]|uniref:Uncharacterized protein n=1 Tax=Basidiobolus meristosporus CBS 931.73 TaxID=1314790 RepID=A0A1Y1Z956_9FUNG|nr:hypothetical protein K493DRAFT_13046 [Basidiobolus meristosporus CBS 931.73]|eukprot:ORY06810.1 hypothetical protein K493DRAFT_13046 [Basidiobolus meristosporus CBS 931.73]